MIHTDAKWIRTKSDEQAVADGCYFDEVAARQASGFIEKFCRIPDVETGAVVPFELLDWQLENVVWPLFGWKRRNGKRRFRKAWIEIAKKNGKSTLCAALIILLLVIDDKLDPQVFSAAVSKDQAAIIFEEAAKMIERSPALSKILEIKRHVKRVVYPRRKGFFRVLPNKPTAVDGINAYGLVFDEIHRQTNRDLYNALVYATDAQPEGMWIIITTAGDSRESIGYELHERAMKILEGSIIDTETLVYVAAAGDHDDPGDPETWKKANPSLGHTLRSEDFRTEYERAKDSPARMQNFRRLKLNQWVTNTSRWIDYDRWDGCPRQSQGQRDQLAGRECYGGLDLSSKYDITAFVLQFPCENRDGQIEHDALSWFWLPEDNIETQEKLTGMPYRQWSDMGLIELTPGDYIDFDYVRARIVDDIAPKYDIREIAYDPAYAQQISIQLMKTGLNVFEFWQRPTMISPPLRYLESVLIEGRIRHGHNPVLNWMAGNMQVIENLDGLIKPKKPQNSAKIDGVVALAMSVGHHCKHPESAKHRYDTDSIIVFE